MKKALSFIVITGLLMQCAKREPDDLLGTWKTDSVYTYYNGFGHTQYEMVVDPLYHFTDDGKLTMTLKGESRQQFFKWTHPDTLLIHSADTTFALKYYVVKLSASNLVLKEQKRPLFSGKNQERFELRFLSRSVE